MAKPNRPRIEPAPPFFDGEEREIIETFEAALEKGEVQPNSPEELARINAEWKSIVEAARGRKATV